MIADEALIKARGAAVGEDVGDGVVDGVVGVAVVGLVVALDVEGLRLVLDGNGLFGELRGLDGGMGLGLGAGGDLAEVALEDGHDGGGFDVAYDGYDDVGGDVVFFVEGVGFGGCDLADFALPADPGAAVGVGDVGGGEELLDHAAGGSGVDAHAALLHDDVALLVKFALDGVSEAGALHVGPEFEAV